MNNPSEQTATDATLFNLFRGELSANPFALLAQMRSAGAVVPMPPSFGETSRRTWIVTRMEEAVQVLKEHKLFTVDPSSIDADRSGSRSPGAPSRPAQPDLIGLSMLSVDEPDHMRLRSLVSKAFTPKYIQSLRPHIETLADELLDKVQDQGRMDIVRDFAYPLPINVISEMMGVPAKDWARIRSWSEILLAGTPGKERRAQVWAFAAYIAQLVAEKRRTHQNDLISQLVLTEEKGDRLDEVELLSLVGLLIVAGHETTSNLISIGTLMLLDHPDQHRKLKADLSLVPSAIEELLRFNGPVSWPIPRFATKEVELGGQHIQRGDIVRIILLSVNRDETQFTQPDELDIARRLNRHIAFGQGIHTCLGAPLARLEGEIAFTTLLRRMPDLHLDTPREAITWRLTNNMRGLTSLPVAF